MNRKCPRYLNWDVNKKHFLFPADPSIEIKNFPLCEQAIRILRNDDYVLHTLGGVERKDMPYYYNASDVVIFTSKGEGSPNVIKEAMACNCKIVSVTVGDVPERFKEVKGCFLCQYQHDVARKIMDTLNFPQKEVTSRQSVIYLNTLVIAKRISEIYNSIIARTRG